MSVTATTHVLTPGEVLARAIAVDRPTAAGVVVADGGTTDRPAGAQVLAAQTVSEVQRLTGMRAFPYTNPSPLTFISST